MSRLGDYLSPPRFKEDANKSSTLSLGLDAFEMRGDLENHARLFIVKDNKHAIF